MFVSVIYVSRRTTRRVVPREEMDALVDGWSERNARMCIRGALLVTSHHIAQILEGPEAAVDQLMTEIRREPRHEQITVIERRPIEGYRFRDWCFAYWGTASYMDQKIAAVMEKHDGLPRVGRTAQLFDLMRLLARESHDRQAPVGNLPRY